MSREFTEAVVERVTIKVRDSKGRQAWLSFDDNEIIFHTLDHRRGKAAKVRYEQLLNLALETNPEFFDRPKSRGPQNAAARR